MSSQAEPMILNISTTGEIGSRSENRAPRQSALFAAHAAPCADISPCASAQGADAQGEAIGDPAVGDAGVGDAGSSHLSSNSSALKIPGAVKISLKTHSPVSRERAAISIQMSDPESILDKVLELLANRFPVQAFYQVLANQQQLVRDVASSPSTTISPTGRAFASKVQSAVYNELIKLSDEERAASAAASAAGAGPEAGDGATAATSVPSASAQGSPASLEASRDSMKNWLRDALASLSAAELEEVTTNVSPSNSSRLAQVLLERAQTIGATQSFSGGVTTQIGATVQTTTNSILNDGSAPPPLLAAERQSTASIITGLIAEGSSRGKSSSRLSAETGDAGVSNEHYSKPMIAVRRVSNSDGEDSAGKWETIDDSVLLADRETEHSNGANSHSSNFSAPISDREERISESIIESQAWATTRAPAAAAVPTGVPLNTIQKTTSSQVSVRRTEKIAFEGSYVQGQSNICGQRAVTQDDPPSHHSSSHGQASSHNQASSHGQASSHNQASSHGQASSHNQNSSHGHLVSSHSQQGGQGGGSLDNLDSLQASSSVSSIRSGNIVIKGRSLSHHSSQNSGPAEEPAARQETSPVASPTVDRSSAKAAATHALQRKATITLAAAAATAAAEVAADKRLRYGQSLIITSRPQPSKIQKEPLFSSKSLCVGTTRDATTSQTNVVTQTTTATTTSAMQMTTNVPALSVDTRDGSTIIKSRQAEESQTEGQMMTQQQQSRFVPAMDQFSGFQLSPSAQRVSQLAGGFLASGQVHPSGEMYRIVAPRISAPSQYADTRAMWLTMLERALRSENELIRRRCNARVTEILRRINVPCRGVGSVDGELASRYIHQNPAICTRLVNSVRYLVSKAIKELCEELGFLTTESWLMCPAMPLLTAEEEDRAFGSAYLVGRTLTECSATFAIQSFAEHLENIRTTQPASEELKDVLSYPTDAPSGRPRACPSMLTIIDSRRRESLQTSLNKALDNFEWEEITAKSLLAFVQACYNRKNRDQSGESIKELSGNGPMIQSSEHRTLAA